MPRPEKIVVGSAGALFVLAAALEGFSRVGGKPALHAAAGWVLMAAVFTVLTPIALAAVVVACQSLLARKTVKGGSAMRTYVLMTGVIFGAVTLGHVLRLLMGWPIQLAGWVIPMWLSWLGILVAGTLCVWAFRLVRRGR